MAPARPPRLVVLVALAALALTGCTVGPSTRPPVAVRGDTPPAAPPAAPTSTVPVPDTLPVPQPAENRLSFPDCTADTVAALGADGVPPRRPLAVGCAELTVPVDPGRPELGPTRVGLTRAGLPGAPAERPPLVVVGDTATSGTARKAAELAGQVSDRLLGTYQLIGMDRRGAGANLLDCAPPDQRAALVDASPDRTDEVALGALLERSRSVAQGCYLSLSGALGSYRGAVTADDLETLRRALGVDRLNVLGVGDGADAVAIWATTRPGSVGRVVLDGPGDPSVDEPDRSEMSARAAESAFDAFALACRSGPACPLGPDPRATVTALVDRAAAQPLPTPDGDRVTAGAVLRAVRAGLAEPRRWPALTAAVAAASGGNPAGLVGLLLPEAGPKGTFDAQLATRCNESRVRLTPPEIADLAARWRRSYPLFGAAAAQALITCAPWPVAAPADRAGPLDRSSPPVVVVGTAQDPRTPLTGTQRLAELAGSARLVRWEGAGTGAYPRTPCVTNLVDRAFVDGTMPSEDVVCPP